jgi:hypothetical protein
VRFAPLPTRFEPNVGQADGRVRFTARTRDGALFLTDGAAVLRERAGGAVRLEPAGARAARAEGLDALPGTTNYFRGSDPSRWRSNVPAFARVRYESVYPGVDLGDYANAGRLEYDFVVAPGADAGRIRLRAEGASSVEVDGGALVLRTPSGEIRQRAPYAYQPAPEGARPVAARYEIVAPDEVRFALGALDPSLPLVVDPAVAFATYLGGTDLDDGAAIAVDASGSVYVAGTTTSADFPTVGALQGEIAAPATSDAYVAKLAPDGASLVYATYLGGGDTDNANTVAVDDTGAAYVAGVTTSSDFPTRAAFQGAKGLESDGFLTKLAPDGASLVFSTFFGGESSDQITDLRVRADHTVVFGGRTSSKTLPTANPIQDEPAGAADAFVTVMNATGSQLAFSTYLGGSGTEQIDAIVLGPNGAVYASGTTDTPDLAPCPPSRGGGPVHAFLARLLPAPFAIVPVGCGGQAIASCVAADDSSGADFRIRALAGGGGESLDTRMLTFGANLASLGERDFGGSGQDYPDAIAVGSEGSVCIVGDTDSADLPTVDPVQATNGGGLDAFVTLLAPDTGEVVFSTYLGGSDTEFPTAAAVDADGNIYVAGVTFSANFPTTDGALQRELRGASDAFVVKISPSVPTEPDFSIGLDPPDLFVMRKARGIVDVVVGRTGGFDGNVTVTAPDTRAIKVKLTPATATTSGDLVSFNYKVKKKAASGTYPLVFTARDASGRTRTATLNLTIQ